VYYVTIPEAKIEIPAGTLNERAVPGAQSPGGHVLAMDLNQAIRDLHEDLKKLSEGIAALEQFQRTGTVPPPRRRGRKSMDAEERKVVAEHMRIYWANRRQKKGASGCLSDTVSS
jgi:hypothetical protein